MFQTEYHKTKSDSAYNVLCMKNDISMIPNPYVVVLRSLAYAVLSIFVFSGTLAQNITETRWRFGNSSQNLIFDQNGRDVLLQDDQATPFGSAGAATITDQFTGNLLFYTDGVNVYDVSNAFVPNGTGLSGNAAINVPVVASPVIGSPGQYYLITNSGAAGVNEIQYSIVDSNSPGNGTAQFPYGDVMQRNSSTGLVDPSEGMIVIPLGDGEVFWLLTQNRNTFEISVSRIDNTGINLDLVYDFTNGSTPGFEVAHFAYFRDSSSLAMAPKTANRNIWLLDFDALTGVLSLDSVITGTGFDDGSNESIYDVEWSGNGTKLFLSRFGGTGTVGQLYQLDFVDSTSTGRIEPILPNPVFRSYGLKRAIDNRVYHLYQASSAGSPYTLGRINLPNQVFDSVDYQPIVFGDDFDGSQFPEFTAGYNFEFDTLGFYWIDSCATNVTKFFPIVDPVPNSLSWNFSEGTSDDWIPSFTFSQENTYQVRLTAEVAGITQVYSQSVTILENNLMVDLGNDTTICIDEVLTLDAGQGSSFVWNTGETTQTIEVDTTGTYWVEVTDATGCTDFDDIEVLEYGVVEQIYNQWYFGERAGIDFNTNLAILDANNQQADEGCATISDINGDLLFYTNGVTVWNREHEVMQNGDEIGGDLLSAQNSLIMPFSGDQTMFYIFTTEQVYGDGEYALKYSIVDMKEDESLGKVIVKDVKLMENSTERITGSGFTGSDFIVAHEFGNNVFRTFATSATGLSGAIYSPSGEIHEFMNELSATGYMKISPTFGQIAVLIPGTEQVEILDFDLGEISNPRLIDTGEGDLYGLEFSPSGNRLYLTTSTGGSKLIQYDLDSLNSANPATDIEATKFDGYQQGSDYGALQLGPDGTIYMAVDNAGSVGTINSPEGDDGSNDFDPAGFDLQGRTSRLGLPNFAQIENSPSQDPSITVVPGCVGQISTFTAVGRDPNNSIENYLWVFGDGFSAAVPDTTHIYETAGTYTVQMVLSNRCDTDTILSTTIIIENLPESPTVPTDTAICDQPIVLSAWPFDNSNFTYQWSTGETTRQITVAEANIINVTITDLTTGCPSEMATVVVGDARPSVDIGADRIFCQDDPPEILDSQVENASTYEWFIDGVLEGSNRTLEVNTSQAGTFEYIIQVQNVFGCTNSDTLSVTVLESPDINFVGNPTTGCGNEDGFLELTFNSSGSYSYELSGTESQGPFNFDGPGTVTIPTGSPGDSLSPGNYDLMVTNLVTGCTRNEVVQIEDPGTFNLTVASDGNCENEVELSLFNVPPSFSYEIIEDDGSIISGSNSQTVFSGLDPGTISIRVTDNSAPNCVEIEQIIVAQDPEPDFTFNTPQQICGGQGNIFVFDATGGAVAYTWNGPGVTNVTGDTITVSQPGIYSVTATDMAALFCPRTEEIEVVFNDLLLGEISVAGDPCEGELDLSLVEQDIVGGSGNYIYSWSNGSQAPQTTVTSSGTYLVSIIDQVTGCDAMASVNVNVQDEFEVELSLEPDCENNGQVFVIATTNVFDPSITYQWEDGLGNVFSETDSVLTVTTSGTYQVTATNASGTCMVTDAAEVAVVPINPEDLILPNQASFCREDLENPTASLDPGIFNTYEWRFLPDETIISSDQVYQASMAGTYEVTIYNGFTCITDQVQVVEDCRPVIIAPNAFSPNGNGENDEFFVFPNDFVANFEILIYTRWGELVFRSENQDFRWDGVYRGQLLPPGTYAYVMKFTSSLNPLLGVVEQYGSITLVR